MTTIIDTFLVNNMHLVDAVVFQEFQPGCDLVAAQQCEYDFLQCRLFTGPADDPETMCNCGEIFFGQCLRSAGCQTHMQVSYSVNPTNYMTQCVSLIMQVSEFLSSMFIHD